jgi:hypothetical protein
MSFRLRGSRWMGSPWRGVGGARGILEGIGVCGSVSRWLAGVEEEEGRLAMSPKL